MAGWKQHAVAFVVITWIADSVLPLGYYSFIPPYISGDNLKLILPNAITANGFLIALTGSMFGSRLESIGRQIFDLSNNLDGNTTARESLRVHGSVEALRIKRDSDRFVAIAVLASFSLSIFFSLTAMGRVPQPTEVYGNFLLFLPFTHLLVGLLFLMYGLAIQN